MEPTKHFSKLRGDKANYLAPPNVQGMITACKWAMQKRDGEITLCYVDDEKESRSCDRDMVREFDGFLSVVNYVQSGRQT